MTSSRVADLSWASAFVGIPYADRGRDRGGCDCWGLVRLVHAARLAVDLPSYDGLYACSAEREEIAAIVAGEAASPSWEAVAEASLFNQLDVLFFRRGGHDAHAGLFLAPGLMLHMAVGDCSKIERFDGSRWARRLTGAYRWRGRA